MIRFKDEEFIEFRARAYAKASLETCENCGREAEVSYSGWVKVLCNKCLRR